MAASLATIQQRAWKARSRALGREGRRLGSLRLQGDKISEVKAVLTRHTVGLSIFKKGERNLIVRSGGQHIGDFFISDYLPFRFERGYARAVLFYRPSPKYEAWKATMLSNARRDERGGSFVADTSQNEPLVLTGALRESALNNSYAVSRSAAGRFSVVVRIPTPATAEGFRYSNNKEVRKVLRALPMKEVKALAGRLGRFIQSQIGRATLRHRRATKKRGPRLSARLGQRQRAVLREMTTERRTMRSAAPARRTLSSTATYSREPS